MNNDHRISELQPEEDEPPSSEANSSIDIEAHICKCGSDRVFAGVIRSILDGCGKLLAGRSICIDQPHPRVLHKLFVLDFTGVK
jgi:hypothetical protein